MVYWRPKLDFVQTFGKKYREDLLRDVEALNLSQKRKIKRMKSRKTKKGSRVGIKKSRVSRYKRKGMCN